MSQKVDLLHWLVVSESINLTVSEISDERGKDAAEI
jgi:hypothetical protein